MNSTFRTLSLALAGIAAATLSHGGAVAQTYKAEYRLSATLAKPFPWGHGAERWAELVREKTDGRINVKVYSGQQLTGGDQSREFTALRQGIIDMAYAAPLNWVPQIRQLNIFAMPFLFPSADAADKALAGALGEELFGIIRAQGVEPLAWGENGYREISNSNRPITSPADLKGLKIRVIGSSLLLDMFAELGANATTMSWADAQPAMSTGAIDGQENALVTFNVAKLHQIGQKHITLWGAVYEPLVLAVNRAAWESWTPEDQAAVREAAEEAARYQTDMSREVTSSLVPEIEGHGVAIVRLDDAQREAFVEATRKSYEKWAQTIGPDLVATAEKAIAGD